MEKARLYEKVKRHSEELEARVREATAELAEQNELLRRQALELAEASRLKDQFLANVSHELRTPLNAVLGYTSLLLEGVFGTLSDHQRDRLERVEANARNLLAIINDLLDIARIEAGKMPLEIERFTVPALVEEVMDEVEPLIERARLAVRRDIATDVPELATDRQKVKQILINLLSNALKFTPEGVVEVEAVRHDELVAIAVRDTGIGISEDHQKTIFEAFGQSGGSYARRQGTGLGLSICRRLATVLGGDIELESRLGEGSTFTLYLPAGGEEAG
jgi:signal transduction histidine kinase